MPSYQKIMRRLISRPGGAIGIVRNLVRRHRKCCPLCGAVRQPEIRHADQRGVYRCGDCGKTFSELRGTIFFRGKPPLSDWLLAIVFRATATGGLSAADLGRKLGIGHPAAWKMLMRIRGCMRAGLSGDLLRGIAEGDEAWFGRSRSKPKDGRGPKAKADSQEIVLGLAERGRRRLRLMAMPDVEEATLYPHIRGNVRRGSKFFTDSRVACPITGIECRRQVANHSAKEFARGEVRSSAIEQAWGDIRGVIRAIRHGIKKKHRELYLARHVFRYENIQSSNPFYRTLCQISTPTYCLI